MKRTVEIFPKGKIHGGLVCSPTVSWHFPVQAILSRLDTLQESGRQSSVVDLARLPFIQALVSFRLCDTLLLSLQERACSGSSTSCVLATLPKGFCSQQDEPEKAFRKGAVGNLCWRERARSPRLRLTRCIHFHPLWLSKVLFSEGNIENKQVLVFSEEPHARQ